MKSKRTLGIVTAILLSVCAILGLTAYALRESNYSEAFMYTAILVGILGFISFTGWVITLVIIALREPKAM